MNQQQLKYLFTYKDGMLFHPDGKAVKTYSFRSHNRILIRVAGNYMALHRAIWVYHRGDLDPFNLDTVKHKDGDPTNNRIDNLRLGSIRENAKRKLSPKDIQSIRNLSPIMSQRELGEQFGVTKVTVGRILRGDYPYSFPKDSS